MLSPSFRKVIAEHKLVNSGDRVIVGVSGGVDSMVLLELFTRLSAPFALTLIVAHVNHGKRGVSSDADEAFVVHTAERLGLPCVVDHWRHAPKKNFQDAARSYRQRFLLGLAHEQSAQVIALGHHQDDQAETILMHLLRGTGLRGLMGMAPCDDLSGVKLIRPLLQASRSEIEVYASIRGIAFRTDESNADLSYRRNLIRHELMPQLRTMNPRIVKALGEMGARLADDESLLTKMAAVAAAELVRPAGNEKLMFDREAFLGIPRAIRRRALILAFEAFTEGVHHLTADHICRLDMIATRKDRRRATYRLPGNCSFVCERDHLIFQR